MHKDAATQLCVHTRSQVRVHIRALTSHTHTHTTALCLRQGQGPPTPATDPQQPGRTFRLPCLLPWHSACEHSHTGTCSPFLAECCSPVIWSKKLTSMGRSPTWPQLHLEAGLADKLVLEGGGGGKQEGGPEGRIQIHFSAKPNSSSPRLPAVAGKVDRAPAGDQADGAGGERGPNRRGRGPLRTGMRQESGGIVWLADLRTSLEAFWCIPFCESQRQSQIECGKH